MLPCIISIIFTNTEKVFHLNPNIELQQGVTSVLEAVLMIVMTMCTYFFTVKQPELNQGCLRKCLYYAKTLHNKSNIEE